MGLLDFIQYQDTDMTWAEYLTGKYASIPKEETQTQLVEDYFKNQEKPFLEKYAPMLLIAMVAVFIIFKLR